jgi:hypothetical protein
MSPAKVIPFPSARSKPDDCCPLAARVEENTRAIEELKDERETLRSEVHALTLRMDDKFSTLQYWLMGIFASVTIGSVGLLIKMALNK